MNEKETFVEDTKALKEAMSFVIGKRMPLPKNWESEDIKELEFPNDLSILTIDQLGSLLSAWSSVMAYVQYEVAKADIDRTARQNRYDFEYKREYLTLVGNEMNEEQRKAETFVRTATLRSDYEVAKAKYILSNALLGAYSKYYQALSRELSRRGLSGIEAAPKESEEDIDFIEGREQLTKQWTTRSQEEMEGDVVNG